MELSKAERIFQAQLGWTILSSNSRFVFSEQFEDNYPRKLYPRKLSSNFPERAKRARQVVGARLKRVPSERSSRGKVAALGAARVNREKSAILKPPGDRKNRFCTSHRESRKYFSRKTFPPGGGPIFFSLSISQNVFGFLRTS